MAILYESSVYPQNEVNLQKCCVGFWRYFKQKAEEDRSRKKVDNNDEVEKKKDTLVCKCGLRFSFLPKMVFTTCGLTMLMLNWWC